VNKIYQSIIFFVVGTILFLYGIFVLSEKFKLLVQERITFYLRKITKNQVKGTIFGFILTALNQSSSATTVLTMALVSSGLLSFYSSLGILFGANIGTTITVGLVALGVTKISFIFILLGFILSFIKKTKKIGEIVFFIGILFFGLFLISLALEPLKNNPAFLDILAKNQNPFLALIYSIIFTAIVQSSAVTISGAIILSQQGILSLPTIMAIIIGANIGTTITVLIASIGGSINSKRTVFAHILFNVGGAILFLFLLWPLHSALSLINAPDATKAVLFHIFFNVITAVISLIFVKQFYKIILKVVPGKDESINFLPRYLNKIFIKKPKIALNLVKRELKREFILTEKMLKKTFPLIQKFENKTFDEINYIENAVDNLQEEILSFLGELPHKNTLTKIQLKQIIIYSFVVNSIERIADRTMNIAQIARYKHLNKENISEETLKLLRELGNDILLLTGNCIALLDDKKYNLKLEIEIRDKINEIKEIYKERLEGSKEDPSSAMLFSELMINIERLVCNCGDIARYIDKK